ncbi:MAG: response regulator, partial [Thermoanaerobaculia bacterium]
MNERKILIVDDDEDILLIVQTLLTNAGYAPILARNGREGIEQAAAMQPDVILLDVTMPQMSGWEVCATLKNLPETSSIPIVMITVKSEIK